MNTSMMMRTSEITSIRYREIRDAAGITLLNFTEGTLPIEPREIVKRMGNCRLIRYSKYEREKLMSLDINAQDFFGSADGCTFYQPKQDRYLIFYNDFQVYENPGRLRWTLAHEIAHIVLKHISEKGETAFQRAGNQNFCYTYLEAEADYFAGMLLAYPVVIKACKIKSEHALQEICGLSYSAARSRFSSYCQSQMKRSLMDELVEKHFERVIEIATLPFITLPDNTRFGW